MGSFDLTSVWEHCWHMQSFPLNVTLSPMGKGLLRSERKNKMEASWQQDKNKNMPAVSLHLHPHENVNTLCETGEVILKQQNK